MMLCQSVKCFLDGCLHSLILFLIQSVQQIGLGIFGADAAQCFCCFDTDLRIRIVDHVGNAVNTVFILDPAQSFQCGYHHRVIGRSSDI